MSQVQQVKDAVNIVDVLGERLDLKRSGSSYKAVCPFHSESSPSFFVNEEMQRYKCFGCGASGDVIEFLEQYDGMSFLEALKYLADRVGIELKSYSRSNDDKERETLLEILDLAQRYFHYLLMEHKLGKPARSYLKERSVTKESIKLFNLGYALPAWDGLFKFLTKKKKYKEQDILQAGLIIKARSGRYYDRFRDRIIFPLKNHRGQVVGFSGRALNKDDKTPKYINSPETKLYHKSQMLYGYKELYQEIRKAKKIIIVEGEFDVVSSRQAHVNFISAIKGSALTEEQARLISRCVEKVLLCLDSDEAGVKATKRAIEVIKDFDLDLRVIDLSRVKAGKEIKDSDDLARENPKLWRETVKQSISVYDFLINVALDKFDPKTPEGKRKIVDDLAPVLNNINHQVEKDFYVKKLAAKLSVNIATLADDVRRFGQSGSKFQRSQPQSKKNKLDPKKHLERYLIFLLFHAKQEVIKDKAKVLQELELKTVGASQVVDSLIEYEDDFNLKKFAQTLAEDLKAKLFDWHQQPEFVSLLDQIKWGEEWSKTLKQYRQKMVSSQISQINQRIEKLEQKSELAEEEQAELQKLLRKIVDLQRHLKSSF
ncbi:MAG: DNA primase [Patescibacteria group bacterium]|nr:DNA primase [Patescibacteria group bacterium]